MFTIRKMPAFLIALLIFLCFIAGLITRMSNILSLQQLNLWKEFLISLIFISSLIPLFPKAKKRDLIIIWLVSVFFIVECINSLNINSNVVLYQIKMDLFPIILLIGGYGGISFLNNKELYKYIKNIYKIFLLLLVINALMILYQHFFPSNFLQMLELDQGEWGTSAGVKVITAGGDIRAIGLQPNFVPSGTIMLMGLIILNETRKKFKINTMVFCLLNLLFIISLLFTTYKTSLIGLIFYAIIKLFSLFPSKLRKLFICVISSILFFVSFISVHFLSIYNLVSKYNADIAYNSIYLRVIQDLSIIKSMSLKNVLFGLGMGVNGIFGLDKGQYGLNPLATDSTYIYLVSNYGFISVIIFVLILIYLIYKLFKNERYDFWGARYLLLYTLIIEFFFNNFWGDSPANLLIILISVISFINIKKRLIIN